MNHVTLDPAAPHYDSSHEYKGKRGESPGRKATDPTGIAEGGWVALFSDHRIRPSNSAPTHTLVFRSDAVGVLAIAF